MNAFSAQLILVTTICPSKISTPIWSLDRYFSDVSVIILFYENSFETSHSQCRLFFFRLVIFVHSYGLQLPDTREDACSEHASPRVSGSYILPFLLYYTTAYEPTITCFCQDPLQDIRHVPFLAPRNSVCRGDEGGQELRDLRWRGCIRRSVYPRETIDNFVMHILRHVTLCNTWCNCEISLRTKLLLQQIVTHCSLLIVHVNYFANFINSSGPYMLKLCAKNCDTSRIAWTVTPLPLMKVLMTAASCLNKDLHINSLKGDLDKIRQLLNSNASISILFKLCNFDE